MKNDMINFVQVALNEAQTALQNLIADEGNLTSIVAAAEMLAQTFQRSGKAISCGNGGSMCDAMHFAEELSGRFREDRLALPAVAISDPAYLTCVANDYGYEQVFARYICAHGRPGDILVAISTSGKSPSILAAANQAHNLGMKVISLTGRKGTALEKISDICICAPAGQYADRVQELHIKIIHILIELVERTLYPELYLASSRPAPI